MKRLALSLIFLLVSALTVTVMAKDVVYLKNGSVIKGNVLEIIPEQSIKIQTYDGSIFVYRMDEVDHMQQESDNQRIDTETASGYYLDRGFRGIVDFGTHIGFGVDAEDKYQISAAFTGGYQFNHFLFVGAGVAPTVEFSNHIYYGWYYDYYDKDNDFQTSVLIPIYGAVRFDFINKKATPFVDLRLGYFVNTKDTELGGLYFYGGIGARIRRFSVSAGCDLYRYNYFNDCYENAVFATVRFGFEF